MAQQQLKKSKFKIKKGDQIVVLTGKDKGSTGEVTHVMTETSRLLVQGINMAVKHNKPSQTSAGGIGKKERSIHVSNVALLDPKTKKPSRIGYKVLKDGKKVRIARKSGETIE